MLVRKLAVILSCLGVVLRLFMFAHGMVMLSLMMVMGGGVVMTGRSMMMLCRWMFSHLNALPLSWAGHNLDCPTFPCRRGNYT